MYSFEIDQKNNRIHLTLTECFNELQSIHLLKEVTERLNELERGFCILCDLSALDEFESKAKTHFRSIMDLCNTHGVKKVIRIIPDPLNNFGLTLMSYFHYPEHISVVNCTTTKDAQKHL